MTEQIHPGDIVQITDERPGLVGAFVLAEDVKAWGIQGFVHSVTSFDESTRIYLRLTYDQFERVGRAVLVPAGVAETAEEGQ